ncbi:hypothetical protein [Motilibacter aurantiacus]|uniref:hypothetical protein n=1 Tax=Motilibacter aurantiacus TaxID=2714955 RepID=UPI0014079BCE|nr:hypothetical protein [Motilibacter aurantiacus]NHC47583.1 hypothetical protein [Motilibacter aurantiacus]
MGRTDTGILIFDETGAALVFASLAHAAGYMEAVDVEEGVYGPFAWTADAEVVEVSSTGEVVTLIPTGRHDLRGLRRRLARTRPDLAGASAEAVRRFVSDDLAEQTARRERSWHRRLARRLRQTGSSGS